MTRILDGRELVGFIKERQAHQVRGLIQHFKVQPRLAIIVANDDPVIDLYTRLKKNYGEDIKIVVDVYKVDQVEVARLIKQLNQDIRVTGVVLQLPIANSVQTDELVNLITPAKDVDGLGAKAKWDSATATAINWLLAGYGIDLAGKKLAIVGNGRLVGRPLAKMWHNSGLEPAVYDINCPNLAAVLRDKDVVVTATGVPGLIKADMLKPKAVVVDAGTADDNGKVVGDLDTAVRERSDLVLTPAKGGVGPLTIAALLDNVIRASYPS